MPKLNPSLLTLVAITVLTVISAILYFYLYNKITSINPSYNLLQYLSGGGGG